MKKTLSEEGRRNLTEGRHKPDENVWEERKVANRKYYVTHKPTGRTFSVYGHPSVHKWEADEYVKRGKTVKLISTGVLSWSSKKEMYKVLARYIQETEALKEDQRVRNLPYVRPEIPVPIYKITPRKEIPLRIHTLSATRTKLTDPQGREYFASYDRDNKVWGIRELESSTPTSTGGMKPIWVVDPICRTLAEAIKHLQDVLDDSGAELVRGTSARVGLAVQERRDGWWYVRYYFMDSGEDWYTVVEETDLLQQTIERESAFIEAAGWIIEREDVLPTLNPLDPTYERGRVDKQSMNVIRRQLPKRG